MRIVELILDEDSVAGIEAISIVEKPCNRRRLYSTKLTGITLSRSR